MAWPGEVRGVRTHLSKIFTSSAFSKNVVIGRTQINYGVDTCHRIICSNFFILYWYWCRYEIKVDALVYYDMAIIMSLPQSGTMRYQGKHIA